MAARTSSKPLSAAEIEKHPAFPYSTWDLKPTQEGKFTVKPERGGYKLAWQIHGTGGIKIVWIMGLGAYKEAWQRQTKHFGHTHGSTYSSLIFDNRGIGDSDVPTMRYSTSSFAEDVHELTQHLGWTQLHVVGVSMGGMIAQEFAYAHPTEVLSLSLLSTAAQIRNTVGYYEHLRSRINLLMPKSIDLQMKHAKALMFAQPWLEAPDEVASGLDTWPTNGDRFAAGEVRKRKDTHRFTRKGFLMQAIAAGWHCKSKEQLQKMADEVGRERILVMHGDQDKMISPPHYDVLMEGLGGVTGYYKKGLGHVICVEDMNWFNETMAVFWQKTAKMGPR